VSQSSSSSQSGSEQNQPYNNSDPPPGYSEQLPMPSTLTSAESGWSSVSLEYNQQPIPAGETPKFCFDHYAIAITLGQGFQLDWQIDGVARGQVQRQMLFHGGMTLIPVKHANWGAWDRPIQGLNLSFNPELLTRNATELLSIDQVEVPPQKPFYDPLILQIGLALKADLESQRLGGRLYAETMANALAVHILRNHSAHNHKPVHYLGGLSPTQLKQVTDYINDHLAQELSLEELATVAQLSTFHFCRAFKRSTGFTPHQ